MALSLFNGDPFKDFFGSPRPLATLGATDIHALAVDVSENDTSIKVKADLPGYKREDLKVRVHDGVLTIDAERKQEEETKTDTMYRMERFYGKVHRAIRLPPTADEGAVAAGYDNGVLSIEIGKKAIEDSAGRDIEIN
mgnify:CR=1 FL=1